MKTLWAECCALLSWKGAVIPTGIAWGTFKKLSRKGWVCKTHEGELAMTTVPGVAPTLWTFSVWDEDVAKKLDGQMGKRVVLHSRELRYVPTTCFGETNYFVDRAEI